MDYLPSEAKQAARERFTGLWAATTTPFGATGELERVVDINVFDRQGLVCPVEDCGFHSVLGAPFG